MAPSCTIFEIFDFEKYLDIEMGSLKVTDSLPVVSYERPIVTVSKMHHF